MARRKTVDVKFILDHVNKALSMSESNHNTRESRNGMIGMLETVLHETGNYNGFRYLTAAELPAGAKPGIVFNFDKENEYTDDSRRYYYE